MQYFPLNTISRYLSYANEHQILYYFKFFAHMPGLVTAKCHNSPQVISKYSVHLCRRRGWCVTATAKSVNNSAVASCENSLNLSDILIWMKSNTYWSGLHLRHPELWLPHVTNGINNIVESGTVPFIDQTFQIFFSGLGSSLSRVNFRNLYNTPKF